MLNGILELVQQYNNQYFAVFICVYQDSNRRFLQYVPPQLSKYRPSERQKLIGKCVDMLKFLRAIE